MKDQRRVVANVLVLFARQITTWGLTTALLLFVPRYLGDEGMGRVIFATSFTGLFTAVILLGTPIFLIKEVARDRSTLGSYFFNALLMRLPGSALVFGVVFVVVNALGYPPETKAVVYVGCLTTIALCLSDTVSSLLQGMERMAWPSIAEVAGKAIVLAGALLFVTRGAGVTAYALILHSCTTVMLGANLAFFIARVPVRPRVDFAVWRALLVGGLPYLLVSVLSTVYQRLDASILRVMTNDAVVGWYGTAWQLLGSLNFIPLLIVTAVLPALARWHGADPEALKIAARKGLGIVLALTIPMTAGAILLADRIIDLLHFPAAFQHSAPLLALLSLDLPVTGTLMVVGTVIVASDRQRRWAKVTALGVVANIVFNVAGIRLADTLYGNGGIGAAAASVASEALILALALPLLPKGLLDRQVCNVLVKSICGALLMSFVVNALRGADTAVAVGAGIAFYLPFSFLVRSLEIGDLLLVRDVILRRQPAGGMGEA